MSLEVPTYRFRRFKLTYLASQFEQILLMLRKGELPIDNVIYFGFYAKNFFRQIKMENPKLLSLIDEWEYWTNVRKKLLETQMFQYAEALVYEANKYINNYFKHISFNEQIDGEIEQYSYLKQEYRIQYTINKINMKLRELLYDIISEIWISIYANDLIDMSEVYTLLEALSAEKESSLMPVEYEITSEIKPPKTTRKIEPTNTCFRRVLKVWSSVLDEFARGFYTDSEFEKRINNCEAYVFSLLQTASKILINQQEIKELLALNASLIKKMEQYKFVKYLLKTITTPQLRELYLTLMNQLERISVEAYDKTNAIREMLEKRRKESEEGEEEEELITYRISGEQELTEYERKNLIGFEINYDLLVGILEQMKFGERLRELELEIKPYTLTPRNLENTAILLGIGKTGSGKTVMGINLIRMFVNNNYTVVDISLNVKRAQEMIYVIMPLNEKYYKKEFHKLTKVQKCVPEKINSIILIPYMNKNLLPKHLPACARFFTISLKSLAGKPHAYPLLFNKPPDKDVVEFVDLIIKNVATDDWDLNNLRYYLKRLIEKKQNYLWVREKIGDMEFERKYEFELSLVKKTLSSLSLSSELISSSRVSTVIDFDELAEHPLFIQMYMGHLDEYTAYLINKWWIYSWIDYKSKNPSTKLTFFLNEAQTVVPSQQMVGGLFSSEKYGSAVDVSDLVLQFRGLGIYVIALTQMPGQLKTQFPSQQGALMVFHTTNDKDIDYAFSDIPNEEMQTNLKMLVKSRFFMEQHMTILKFGPEADQIKILLSALPPCAIERPNIDVFDLYRKLYPQETVETKELIKKIEEERKTSLKKALEIEIGQGLVKVLEEGKTLVPVSDNQVVLNKEEIEKISSEAIPLGHTVVPKEVAVVAQSVASGDKVLIEKETLQKLVETKPVSEDQIVIPRSKYEQLIANYGLPSMNELVKSEEKVSDLRKILKMLLIALKPDFGFIQTNRSKNPKIQELIKSKKLIPASEIASKLSLDMQSIGSMSHILRSIYLDTYYSRVFKEVERIHKVKIYWVQSVVIEQIKKQLGEEYCNNIYQYCAKNIYPFLPDLPWRDEVKNFLT
jgi:hypothetical protein